MGRVRHPASEGGCCIHPTRTEALCRYHFFQNLRTKHNVLNGDYLEVEELVDELTGFGGGVLVMTLEPPLGGGGKGPAGPMG